ncbi:DUF1489 family protein [Roseivivax sp. CAU 1761]
MPNRICHLLKLSAGTDSVESLARWQASAPARGADGHPRHVTRMWPKREAEITAGGSIFWVIKGLIQARQRVLRFEEVVRADGIRRCELILDPELLRVTPVPRRAFQGWRYLEEADAPRDLDSRRQAEETLPPELAGALAEMGVI